MLRRLLTPIAATLVLAAVAAAPERAAAHWLGTPNAIAGSDVQGGPSDLLQVRRGHRGHFGHRGHRGHGGNLWWGVPFLAAPLFWDQGYYAYDYGPDCGWYRVRYVTPKGHVRIKRVWRCY
jgi:hypothetical protein